MADTSLTADLKRYAREQGADVVGIGSMGRFEGVPLDCDPRPIMPEATHIVGMAFRIHRGNLLDLLEPGLGHALPGAILANERFPADWFEHAARCPADGACPVCEQVLRETVVSPADYADPVRPEP